MSGEMTVGVAAVHDVAQDVRSLVLRAESGQPLPSWSPGSHVDLKLPSGLIRQYSLCGAELDDPSEYLIAVLRERSGQGGSRELHDDVGVGTRLGVSRPRNRFELRPAKQYAFVAGGIGITPILPMLRWVQCGGIDWQLHYGGRARDSMAFLDELERFDARVRLFSDDREGVLPLARIVDSVPEGAAIYACGPTPMLEAIEQVCGIVGKAGLLHTERFTGTEVTQLVDGDEVLTVRLRRRGVTLRVPPGVSVLQAVRELDPSVPFSCEEGYCGTCETVVVRGRPEHRDTYLTDEERATGQTMMICVSRALDGFLELDI